MRRAAGRASIGALALLVAAPACIFGRSGGDVNALEVLELTGTATSRAASTEQWSAVAVGSKLRGGAAVRLAPGASLKLVRGRASVVEVRPYDQVTPAELSVVSPGRISIASGDVLVSNAPAAPIAVESSGVEASGNEGVFRFDRRLSVRVGVYEGVAVVSSPAGRMDVPTLREAGLLRRQLPRAPRPLSVRPGDPWDARLLSDVIDLDRELIAQKRGVEAEFRRLNARALRPFAGRRNVSFVDARRYRGLSSGDKLIGVVLALVGEEAGRGAAADLFAREVELLESGATWGLIAKEADATARLLDAVVRAIGLLTGDVQPEQAERRASGSGSGSGSSGGGGGGGGGGSPSPSPTGSKKPSPTPTRTKSPSPSPSSSPSPSPTPSCDPLSFVTGNCTAPTV